MLNIRSVNVYFFAIYLIYIYIYIYIYFFSGPQFEKTGFKNLELSLYLCIKWF